MLTNNTPTVPAPSQRSGQLPPPPRVPYEFGPFARDDYAPESDPLRDLMPLRSSTNDDHE